MLLRGVYTFEPRPEDHDHTLPFTCNDTLVFLEVLKRDPNWLKVADIYGRVGYVPKIFVEPDEDCNNPDLVKSFLVDAVIKARQNKLQSAYALELLRDEVRESPSVIDTRSRKMLHAFNDQEQEVNARRTKSDHHLNRQSSHRIISSRATVSKPQLGRCGSIEDAESQCKMRERHEHEVQIQNSKSMSRPRRNSQNQMRVIRPQQQQQPQIQVQYQSDMSVKTAHDGSEGDGSEDERVEEERKEKQTMDQVRKIKTNLVSVIQDTAGLNPKVSENILNEVFQQIKNAGAGDSFFEKLSSSSLPQVEETGAMQELSRIMRHLSKLSREGIRQDGTKRKAPRPSSAELERLRKLLIESEPSQVTQKLELGHHSLSQELVHLYQMECPMSVKEKMLDIFLIICSLDKKGRPMLLSSKLPIYLARELMSANTDTKIFSQVVDLLTTLLSCGETMPDTHFQILGTGFTNYILRNVEDTFAKSSENEYDKISPHFSAMIKLILAYNLQFSQNSKENIVLKVVAERWKRPRGFITVMIDLFRKAADPLNQERDNDFIRPLPLPHSVFKMVADMCLCQKTVSHLTPEDRSTLVNSIIDGLCENPAGSTRMGYLQVLRALLSNIQQSLKDVRTVLLSIFLEEDPLAIPEQQLIRQMSKEYPALFMRTISRIKTNVNIDTDLECNLRDDDNGSYLSS